MSSETSRLRLSVRGALLLAIALVLMAAGCSLQTKASTDASPTLIPEGRHLGLRPTQSPRQDVDKAKFIFLAAGHTDENGPRWYGYPTDETVYSVDSSETTLEDFERTLADIGAYQFDVQVEKRGELASINAILPEVEP